MTARRTLALIALVAAVTLAQRGRFVRDNDADDVQMPRRDAEFHFIRLEYTDLPQFHRGWGFSSRAGMGSGWWNMDWPAADNHFTAGLQRLTRIDTGDPRHLRLMDDKIFDYPWIYATQTGYWDLREPEIKRLREYLLRGGFLVTDDMFFEEQWEIFAQTMGRVLPGRAIDDIAETDSVMHVLFDIEPKDLMFIPGSRHLRRGPGGTIQVMQPQGAIPAWRAMYDDRNRMVVFVNYNTDVADAWEFADVPYYPEAMTGLAYRYGINYVVYSMTH